MSKETIAHFTFHPLYKSIFLLLLCGVCFYPSGVFADKARVLVLYPAVREPFNQVYISLFNGVAQKNQLKAMRYELQKDESVDDYLAWIEKKKPKGIIALGNRSVNFLESLGDRQTLPVVVGGAVIDKSKRKQLRGISLAPAPKHLFAKLKQIRPEVERVNVIYNPATHQWLIDEARAAALASNIKLEAKAVSNIRELALAYRDALKAQKPKTEALWLPHTGYSLDKAILNHILESAWKQDLVVFSSKLADVSRGVLFSLYPDNQKMGLRLSELLLEELSGGVTKADISLSDDLHAALNTRTAEHLGMSVDKQLKKQFQLLFPIR